MKPTIYILTMGRPHKQLTYNLLPDFLKEKVVFVIRDFEVEYFKDKNYKVCPEWVTNVSTTRKFIQQLAGDSYHWVMDDDIKLLYHRFFDDVPGREDKLLKKPATDEQWHLLCDDIQKLLDKNFGLITLSGMGFIPSHKRFPYKEGLCGTQWFCMNGALMKNVQWDRINLSDDFDGCLQAISQGVKVVRFEKYLFLCDKYGAPGGCADDRTTERNNAAVDMLMKYWPKYVLENKNNGEIKNYSKQSVYGGTEKKRVKMFFIKAYKDYAHLRV